MTRFPPSLFEAPYLLRPANKPAFSDALLKLLEGHQIVNAKETDTSAHVIDGGSLIQRIPWPRGSTYSNILDLYNDHLRNTYGSAVMVFDGYPPYPTTKDVTHYRRTQKIGEKVNISETAVLFSFKKTPLF